MLRKITLVSSILMSAATLSATANAGSTITDKSYWPAEIRQQTRPAAIETGVPSNSFAYEARSGDASQTARAGAWTYNGGPKSR